MSGSWTTAIKTLPLASQETCAAMEFYHNQLKVRLLNEKKPGVYQRADWLVDKLGTKVLLTSGLMNTQKRMILQDTGKMSGSVV